MVKASLILFALKNTQAKYTSKKFDEIPKILENVEWALSMSNTLESLGKYLLKELLPIKKRPCSRPHRTNVQFAPCQIPLTKNVISRLSCQRGKETLFPPKEI